MTFYFLFSKLTYFVSDMWLLRLFRFNLEQLTDVAHFAPRDFFCITFREHDCLLRRENIIQISENTVALIMGARGA